MHNVHVELYKSQITSAKYFLCALLQEEHAPAEQWPGGAGRVALAAGWDSCSGLGTRLLLYLERGRMDWKGVAMYACYFTYCMAMVLQAEFIKFSI